MRALEPLHLSSELEAFYNDRGARTGRRSTAWHCVFILLIAAAWHASTDAAAFGPHVWLGAVAYICALLGHEALLSGKPQGQQRSLRAREAGLVALRILLTALYPVCASGLARTLGLGGGFLGGAQTFVKWPGRGVLRGQLQRLLAWGQRAIHGTVGSHSGGGSGSSWALLWHLLVSSGAVHQSLLALALPLSFRTHLAVTLISSVVMNLLCNDAACAALSSSPQLRRHVGEAASLLSVIHGVVSAPGPFGGGIFLPAISAGAPLQAAAGPVVTAAALLAAAGLAPGNSSLGAYASQAGVAAVEDTAATGPVGGGAIGGRPVALDLTAWNDWGLPAPLLPSAQALAAQAAPSGGAMPSGLGEEAATEFVWPGCWAVVSFVQVLLAVGVTSTVVYFAEWAQRQAFVDRIRDLQQNARLRQAQALSASEAGPSCSRAAAAPANSQVGSGEASAAGDELEGLLPRLVLPPPPEHDFFQYVAKAVLLALLGLAWWDALLLMKAATLQLA